MKNKILMTILSFSTITVSGCYAQSATWLDGGSTVHASTQESNASKDENNIEQENVKKSEEIKGESFEVTLATGANVTIVGGVYVKTNESEIVLDWASRNGYEAEEHKIIENAINVKTTPQEAIAVANAIAKLQGVTTAAPKQGRVLVTK